MAQKGEIKLGLWPKFISKKSGELIKSKDIYNIKQKKEIRMFTTKNKQRLQAAKPLPLKIN